MLVFVVSQGDKMYSVLNFPEYLQEDLEEDLDVRNLKVLDYDKPISVALNAVERKMANGAALASLMTNTNFYDSYIILATNA